MTSRKADLYRHFDNGGNLLYVGISFGAIARLQQHRLHSHWYHLIEMITIEKFEDRRAAERAERRAIATEKPLYNIAHLPIPPASKPVLRVKPKPIVEPQMFGPPAPYKGRPVGLVSGDVPEGFPVPHERIFAATGPDVVKRVIKVCWPEDTIHVLNADFPAHIIPELASGGINVVLH